MWSVSGDHSVGKHAILFLIRQHEIMVNVSCVIITIFVLVSLINFVLLLHVIMQLLTKSCDDGDDKKIIINKKLAKIEQLQNNNHMMEMMKTSINKYKFMTAIIQVKPDEDDIKFVCSGAIISQNLVLTPGHCGDLLLKSPLNQFRVSSNSSKWKYGIWHDLNEVVVHEKFDSRNLLNDIALIRVKQPFKAKNELPVALPNFNFKYSANTSAFSLGWMENDGNQNLYGVNVKLFWYKLCEIQYPGERILDNGKLCAGRDVDERIVCMFDQGGQLIQKNMLIGLMSFKVGCEGYSYKPSVYTKISYYESWIRYIEKTSGVEGKTIFKSKP